MNIFVNIPEEQTSLLNNLGEFLFTNNIEKNIDVAVVVYNKPIIEQVLIKNKPTVVLVDDYTNKNSKTTKKLLEQGFPSESLIFKDRDRIKNYIGKLFNTPTPRGVGLHALIELAEYAVQNKLYPELIIWNPAVVDFPQTESKQEVKTEEPKKEQERKPEVIKQEPVKERALEIFNLSLEKYVKNHNQVIFLIKPNAKFRPHKLVKQLLNRRLFNLLDITQGQSLFSLHGNSQEEAISTGNYAVIKDGQVTTSAIAEKTLVIILDNLLDNLDIVDSLYESVNNILFLLSSNNEDIGEVINWLNNGSKLDGILTDNENKDRYEREVDINIYDAENFNF